MDRLELVSDSSGLALWWGLSFTFSGSIIDLLLWYDLVKVDPSTLVVANKALKLSKIGVVKNHFVNIRWWCIILCLRLLLHAGFD